MDFSAFLRSLENSGLATSPAGLSVHFPFIESVHVMALALVFGSILVVDLRALGIASTNRSFTRLSTELLRITWGAFAVSALTGSLMFVTNARVYAHNTAFQVKMVLLALAGLNMALFHPTAGWSVSRWDRYRPRKRAGSPPQRRWSYGWGTYWPVPSLASRQPERRPREAPVSTVNFDDFLNNAPASGASRLQDLHGDHSTVSTLRRDSWPIHVSTLEDGHVMSAAAAGWCR